MYFLNTFYEFTNKYNYITIRVYGWKAFATYVIYQSKIMLYNDCLKKHTMFGYKYLGFMDIDDFIVCVFLYFF